VARNQIMLRLASTYSAVNDKVEAIRQSTEELLNWYLPLMYLVVICSLTLPLLLLLIVFVDAPCLSLIVGAEAVT